RRPPDDFSGRARAASKVITVSQANADYMSQNFGVLKEHIRVIPCGVDLEHFRPAPHTGTNGRGGGAQAAPPLIVCVARQVEVKNLRLLLHSCALLSDRGVKFCCVQVGDGPCRSELEVERARLGLEQIVEMPGAAEQREVLSWWHQAT